MTRYMDTLELKVPLFVLRGLVNASFAHELDPESEDGYWHAIKWLADRPIYRAETLNDDLVVAVYQRKQAASTVTTP